MYVESDIQVLFKFAGDSAMDLLRRVTLHAIYDNGDVIVKGQIRVEKNPSIKNQTADFDSIRDKSQIHDFCDAFARLTFVKNHTGCRILIYADPFMQHRFAITISEVIPDNPEIVPLLQSYTLLSKLRGD